MIDYRYKTFMNLVETKNYTKTAENLNFTQPAITKHIQFIEKELNVQLFTYSNRQLTITEHGKKIYESLKKITKEINYIQQTIKESSHLKIGVSKTIGEFYIADRIAEYNRLLPLSEVSLIVDNTYALLQLLDTEKIDLALLSGPCSNSNQNYEISCFHDDKILLVCANQHPYANKTVTLSDILDEQLFIREPGSGILESIEQKLSKLNYSIINFSSKKTIGNTTLIKSLVKKNGGISFFYKMAVAEDILNGKLSTIELSDFAPRQNFFLVKKHTLPSNPNLNQFTRLLHASDTK